MRTLAATLLTLTTLVLAGCVQPAGDVDAASTTDIDPADLPDLPLPSVVHSLVVDATRWSGEPSILAMRDGTLLITGAGGLTRYVEDPADAPGNAGQSYIWRSTDGGATWAFVDLGLPGPAATLLPYRNAVPGVEGDLAEDESGRAYFVDLAALATNGLSASDDGGATWTAAQNPVAGLPGTDRPWVAAVGDGEVYVKYLQALTGWRVARSTDGGLTFLEEAALPGCGQADMTVDFAAGHVIVPCHDGTALYLMRTPTGATMDWERVDAVTAEGAPANVFLSAAVADEGEYVLAWAEDHEDGTRLRVAWSLDAGDTWQGPTTVSTADRTAVFPWVDAHSDGTTAVVWYEADEWGPSDTIDAQWWPLHARLRLDAETGTLDLLERTRLSAEAVHEGSICLSGLGCVLEGRAEDRRLLDFFEVDVDAAGASHVTWTSTRTDVPTIWYGQVAPG